MYGRGIRATTRSPAADRTTHLEAKMMKEMQDRLGAVGLVVALQAACIGGPRAPLQEPVPESRMASQFGSKSDVVGGEELQSVPDGASALDALQRLRPEFLTRKAAQLPTDPYGGYPVVYLDGQRLGELSTLQGIPLRSIVEIRFLRTATAAQHLGRTYPGGVIAVSTRR